MRYIMKKVDMIVKGCSVIPAHDITPITDGAIAISNGKVVEVGKEPYISEKYTNVLKVIGGSKYLVIPGLVNSHGHGRGLSDFQRGALDNTLETWLLYSRGYIPVPTYEDVAYSAIRLLKSGVTTTMHNILFPLNIDDLHNECIKSINAYRNVGLRNSFCIGIRNANPWIYGDNKVFIDSLSQNSKNILESMTHNIDPQEYFQLVRDLHDQFLHDPITCIGFGPVAPQWCTADLLQKIKKEADELGLLIHLHTLQTVFQKIYSLKTYGVSLIKYLDGLGLLDQNMVLGHCVFPTMQDLKIMAKKGVGVTHHPTCNLRQRNGIAPVYHMLQEGIKVGLGLDGSGINDDDDFIQEMKICRVLHMLSSLELDSPCLNNNQILMMATDVGAELLGFKDEIGRLEPGYWADMVLLDAQAMTYPFTDNSQSPIDLLLYRGGGRFVDTVLVQGEIVLEKGCPTKVDENQIVDKLAKSSSRPLTFDEKNSRDALSEVRQKIRQFYSGWSEYVDYDPYYVINTKIDGFN